MRKRKSKKVVGNVIVYDGLKTIRGKKSGSSKLTRTIAVASSIAVAGSATAVGISLASRNLESNRSNARIEYNTGYSENTNPTRIIIDDNTYADVSNYYESDNVEIPTYADRPVSDSELDSLLQKSVSIDSSIDSTVTSTIHDIQIEYDESDLFGIDEALNEYYSIPKPSQGAKFTVNENDLYNTVRANNAVFLTQGKGRQCWELSDSDLRKAVAIVAKNANEKINAGYITDYNNLAKVLSELKIVAFSDFSTASTDDKSVVLAIDMASVKKRATNFAALLRILKLSSEI